MKDRCTRNSVINMYKLIDSMKKGGPYPVENLLDFIQDKSDSEDHLMGG